MASPVNTTSEGIHPAEWRAAMGRFPTGVTIVTSWFADAPTGTTVNAFCSVSLEPPLLLICLDHANPVLAPIQDSGSFGVNFLASGHDHLARLFGRNPEADRFADLAWRRSEAGAPQLEVACVFVECVLEQAHIAGDHMILVGRGVRIDHASPRAPLLYHRGAFPDPSDPKAWG